MFDDNVFQQVNPPTAQPLSPTVSKTESLAERRNAKVQSLSSRVGYGEHDRTDSYADIDGYNEHLQNKILNDYSPYELEYIGRRLNNEFGVVQTQDGFFREQEDGSLTPFQGDPRQLASYYEYLTADGNLKSGTWGGMDPGGRYADDYLSTRRRPEFVGELGVDRDALQRHYTLDRDKVQTFEALRHGSRQAMENRVIRQLSDNSNLAEYRAARDRIGTGATEVYRPFDLTAPENFDGDALWAEVSERFGWSPSNTTPVPDRPTSQPGTLEYFQELSAANAATRVAGGGTSQDRTSGNSRVLNVAGAVGASLTRSLLFDSAAAVVSLFGGELGTEDSRRELANRIFSYDDTYANEAIEKISERVERMYDAKELNFDDVIASLGYAVTAPEVLGDSIGVLVGTFFGLGKFTRTGSAIRRIEKSLKAGHVSPGEAKAAVANIKSTSSLMDSAARITASNVGYGATVAGMTNNAVNEFLENNDGQADVYDVLRIGAFNAAIAGIDRFSGRLALRDIPGARALGSIPSTATKAIKDVVSEMPPGLYAKAADSTIKVLSELGKIGGASAFEGVTEYAQTMAEVFSTKYASEKYGSEFGELFFDRAHQIEALTGAVMGVAMGAEMSAAGTGVRTLQSVGTSASGAIGDRVASRRTPTQAPSAEDIAAVQADRATYSASLNRLATHVMDGTLSADTLADHLTDIEELRRTREAVRGNNTAEAMAEADNTLSQIEDAIANLILASPDGNFVLNRITEPVPEGSTDVTLNSRPLTPEAQQALAETAIDIVASRQEGEFNDTDLVKLNNFASINGLNPARVERIIKSHASVESEATVEDRGILGRERALNLMLGSGTVEPRRIQRAYDEAVSWLSTTRQSISQLEDGVRKAQEAAATANNSALRGRPVKPVITEYQKHTRTNGKPDLFDIPIRYDGTQYTADVAQAQRLISDKTRTATGLTGLINQFHQKAVQHLDENSVLTSGGYRVPSSRKTSSKAKDKGATEARYLEAVNKVLAENPSLGSVVNKVILGEKPEARWSNRGQHSRVNSLITNVATTQGGTYTSSDVVYVHAGGSYNVNGRGETPFYNSELHNESTPAGKEILAAVEAGATIVLDSQYRVNAHAESSSDYNRSPGVLIARFLASKGYIPVGALHGENSVEGNMFVPDTEDNARRLAASKKRAEDAKAAATAKEARQARLSQAAVDRAAIQLPDFTELDATEVAAEVEAAIADSRQDFVALATRQVQESLAEGETATQEAIDARIAANIETFMDNQVAREIRETRVNLEREGVNLAEIDGVPPALLALVNKADADRITIETEAQMLLTGWKKAFSLRETGQALIGTLNEALKETGKKVASRKNAEEGDVVLRAIGDTVLDNSAGATNNIKSYSVEYQVIGNDGKVTTEIKHPVFNPDRYPVSKPEDRKGPGRYVLNVNEISHNPTEYLTVDRITPLNTIEVSGLPEVFQRLSEQFAKNLAAFMPKMTSDELNIVSGRRSDEAEAAVMLMMDSPARSLIFDSDGNVHPSMALAMGVAVGDLLKTDSFKLTLGNKDTKSIAAQFRVSESEVTQEMRDISSKHGSLMKTVAHNLGTSALKALGISKLKNNNLNRGQYERMVSDLGNYIIAAAEQDGILKVTEIESNALAEVYRDAETIGSAATTAFVHIPAKKGVDKTTGVFTTTFNKGAEALNADYALITDVLPDPTTNLKEPRFGTRIPLEEQNDILSSIRNDAVGGHIPAQAKETLRNFMNTAYEVDMENTGKFLDEISNPDTRAAVLKTLGHIEISENNPDYVNLSFAQKEIQESINRDIESSIEHLANYYEAIQNGLENTMYFPFYYTTNHRFMMDSNTVNGQADKLHRFFIRPKSHNVTYEVNRSDNSFVYHYTENGESKSIDSSFYVRAALAQGLGIGIDKTATMDIVTSGNVLLSMSEADTIAARAELLNTGEFKVNVGNDIITYEPDHLSHGLQALEFIRKYKSSEDATFSDALTAEFDALTSGFSNKMQQFGTIMERIEAFRRVGIIEPGTNTAEALRDPTLGINTMLSNKNQRDSYQGLAADTILDLPVQVAKLPVTAKALFGKLTALLPGADQLNVPSENIDISSKLRNLFKPAFMIFNYSAGINRITKNLSEAMAAEMFAEISRSDYTNKTIDGKALTEDKIAAAQALADIVYNGKGKKRGVSILELQRRLRTESANNIKIVTPVWDAKLRKPKDAVSSIEKYLVDHIITPTYGESVKETFNNNFKEFIEIQNVTNDAFKLSFAVFGKMLQDKVSAFRAETNNSPISEEQLLQFIGELHEAFPVIAGPLSDSLKDGVYVYDTETRTPEGTLSTTVSPRLRYGSGQKRGSRKVNPLIRSIIAAANSGAVLPFHALDGAQLSTMINEFVTQYLDSSEDGAGILPLHDAVMGPLPFSDLLGFLYNKNTVELNKNYSIIAEIKKMSDTAVAIATGKHEKFTVDGTKIEPVNSLTYLTAEAKKAHAERIASFKERLAQVTKDNASDAVIAEAKSQLKSAEHEMTFLGSLERVNENVTNWNNTVEQSRSTMYPTISGEPTRVGVLVTTPGGVYTEGQTGPNLDYLATLANFYETVPVSVVKTLQEIDASKPKKVNKLADKFYEISGEYGVMANMSNVVMQLKPRGLRANRELDAAAKGSRLGTNINPDSDSVVMVTAADKVAPEGQTPLSEAEINAVTTSWDQSVKAANSALNKGATLVFSDTAVRTEDLGDDAINGESYVFNRVTQSKNYSIVEETVDGVTVHKVSKNPPPETSVDTVVTLLDDTGDGNIPTEAVEAFRTLTRHRNTTRTKTNDTIKDQAKKGCKP